MNEFYSELLYTYHQDSSINILLYLIYSVFVHLFIYLLFFCGFLVLFCLPPIYLTMHTYFYHFFFLLDAFQSAFQTSYMILKFPVFLLLYFIH